MISIASGGSGGRHRLLNDSKWNLGSNSESDDDSDSSDDDYFPSNDDDDDYCLDDEADENEVNCISDFDGN